MFQHANVISQPFERSEMGHSPCRLYLMGKSLFKDCCFFCTLFFFYLRTDCCLSSD